MSDNICFVPARNSSTRLKEKNIAPFRDENLITHTIKQAKLCGIFDRIILSSNDEKILEMGHKHGVELQLREDTYDQLIDVITHAIQLFQFNEDDVFGLLLVTNPLRKIIDIIEAYKIFQEVDRGHCVVSVKENENPVQMAWKTDDGHLVPVMSKEYYMSTRKQDHYKTYCYNDAIIFDTVKNFMAPERYNLFGNTPIPYFMPWERSIAIDYEFQLKIAQCLGGLDG